MNKQSRKELSEIVSALGDWADEEAVTDRTSTPEARIEAVGVLEDLQSRIDTLSSDERDKYDNMPEGLQNTEVGLNIEEAATALENASSKLGDAISVLTDTKTDPATGTKVPTWGEDSASELADHVQEAIDEAESF